MLFLKRRRKTEKGASHPNLKQEGLIPVPCASLPPAPVTLHNISSSCKINAGIMSTVLPLLRTLFLPLLLYTTFICKNLNANETYMCYSYSMKYRELNIKKL